MTMTDIEILLLVGILILLVFIGAAIYLNHLSKKMPKYSGSDLKSISDRRIGTPEK